MRFHSLGFVLGSALLMLSLFLPLCWNFIPDIDWTFFFYDASCKCFSLSPTKTASRSIQALAPFYFNFLLVPIYIYCRGLIPIMDVRIRRFRINLWHLHIFYLTIQAVDLFISYLQIPYYRTFFIMVGCALQIKWLLGRD